jgi:hypothetical protein
VHVAAVGGQPAVVDHQLGLGGQPAVVEAERQHVAHVFVAAERLADAVRVALGEVGEAAVRVPSRRQVEGLVREQS